MIQGILGCCYQILIMGCVVVGFCVSCVCEGRGVVEGGFVVVAGVVIMSEYDVYFTGNVMGLLGEIMLLVFFYYLFCIDLFILSININNRVN